MNLHEAMQGHMMDAQIDADVSPRYFELKEQRLGYFVRWCATQGVTLLEDVTPNVLRAFIVHLQSVKAYELNPRRPTEERPLSPTTIKGYMLIVQAFFSWCEKEGLLEGRLNPTRRVPRVKVPKKIIRTFTADQLAAMLDACDLTTALGYRDYAMLLTLMDTGVRVSELCGLNLDDVHEGYLTVFGKGAKEREVGIGPTASRALWKYLHVHRPKLVNSEEERHVFLGYRGIPMLRNGVNQALERIGRRAGLQGVRMSPHTFRHTFARGWLENGGEIFKLSRVLGHSEMQTTQIYLRDFQSREARADHAQFSPVEQLRLGKGKSSKRRDRRRP
jgi:site-specific recombinase XerD